MSKGSRILLPIILILFLGLTLPSQSAAQPAPLIQILSPGDGSQVTAPISLLAQVQPGRDGLCRVTLMTEPDKIISRQLIRTKSGERTPIALAISLPFEIQSPSAPALLTVATQDAFHRPLSLRSVQLLLAQTEKTISTTPANQDEPWLKITSPLPLTEISGGKFRVQGILTPLTATPVYFDLVTDSGGVIGTSQLPVTTPGQPLDFDLALSYDFIITPRDVRLVVRQSSDTFATTVILDSLLLTLSP